MVRNDSEGREAERGAEFEAEFEVGKRESATAGIFAATPGRWWRGSGRAERVVPGSGSRLPKPVPDPGP